MTHKRFFRFSSQKVVIFHTDVFSLPYNRSRLPLFKLVVRDKYGKLFAPFLLLLLSPGGFKENVSSQLTSIVNTNQEEALPSCFNLSGNNGINGINGGTLACSKGALMSGANLSTKESER